jgi:hypothetical protein
VALFAGERLFPNGSVWNQLDYGTNQTLSWTLAGTAPLETVRLAYMFWGAQHVMVSGWPASAAAPTTPGSPSPGSTACTFFAPVAPKGMPGNQQTQHEYNPYAKREAS